MKEALRKLEGSSFGCQSGQIQLLQTFRQDHCEFDQLYFLTQQQNLICKVYDLEAESSQERFRHEQQVYLQGKYTQLADFMIIEEVQIKKIKFGVVLLKITKNSFLQNIYSSLTYNDWLNLTETILDFTEKLRAQKQVFLNINPWSIAKNSDGEFKILDAQFLTNQGSYQELSANNYILIDICENQYHYHSPQLLDEYSKNKIDFSSDLFSFATVLYELLFHQYPFDSKLSQINSYFKLVQSESAFFLEFIELILKPYPKRPTVQHLKLMLQNERKKIPKELISKNMSSGSTNQSKNSNIFSGITQMFSKLTTETQGWYLNFTENDGNRPEEKYLSLIVNKLYKKQTKLEKLLSIILKYIQNSEIQSRENQIIKTLLLILTLFRKGPNTIMNYQWDEVLNSIEAVSNKNSIIIELCNFCKQKLAINSKLKSVFRGNFFIQDLIKFKLFTLEMLQILYTHLVWVIESINTKLLFLKQEKPVLQYAREVYCDEILDCISMLIFSVICIRKDNQLQFRKDNLGTSGQLQKKLNNLLKKISNLSNHVSAHAIYSLQGEFFYYKEQIQLKQKPYFTSLQQFYKNSREYKGLCIPQNFALTYSSGDQKGFLSNENNRVERQKSEQFKEKKYFQEEDSDGQKNSSFKVIETPSPQKLKSLKKEQFLQKLNLDRPQKKQAPKIDTIVNLQPNKTKILQQKKTISFDQFFNLDTSNQIINAPINNKIVQFQFDRKEKQAKIQQKKPNDFTFFEAFMQPSLPKKQKSKDNTAKKNAGCNYLQLFGLNSKEKQQKNTKDKSCPLGNSNSQKLIQQNLLSYDWLKKSALTPILPQKPKINPQILNDILKGLKLKELKQVITSNQEIIIDFKKLKLQKVIGSGSAGQVYLGKYDNEILAIKKVKTQNPNALKEFQRQLLTYIKIKRNPYLVSLVGLSKSEDVYYLLTQFCNSGSLFDLLHKRANTTPLSWKQRIQLALQIAKGMLALHEMNPPIIHRDLKSLNVFVAQNNGKFIAKVADFGLSRSPQAQMMTMYLGTLHWMAPELLDNKQYSIKVDVYSYAIVLWQICARKTPYNELSTPMAIIKHVTIEKKRPNASSIPPDCPPPLVQLMKSCWIDEPNDRPSFTEIIDKLSKTQVFC